ncbi:MAG: hypothetical protein HOA08_00500 [Rhodospirillaceae bacterium]|nr:hypothetical protein [Rhodospirillaceae bacterium]MBT4745404.1 hypothetical protein [Rhodospirillaceae bacterium]MBT5127992.1 hypothetical protein [Rhodospirillaceae bacterium]MBT6973368.1 hypothetical protein [Rhodospirillaceae bacterium]
MLRFSFPFVLAFSILQMSGQPSNAQVPTAVAPRIMLNPDIVRRLRSAALVEPDTVRRLALLRQKAEEILNKPLLSYLFEATYHGKPALMLKTSRKMMKRATTLGLAWNLWQDERYARRGRDELLAVAEFENWNPVHFLDTAEMSAAVGIGLDWFAAFLSHAEKDQIVDALIEKGIMPGLKLYEGAETTDGYNWIRPRSRGYNAMSPTEKADHGWPVETFNWNIVCNSGLTIAALAVRPYDPKIADKLLRYSVKSIKNGFDEYTPDGGFPEGADYWSYATRYAAMFLDSVTDVLGEVVSI